MGDIKAGTIQITGLADLEKRLLAFPDKLAKNILIGAIRAGAVVVQKEARHLAPESAEAHWLGKKDSKSHSLIQPGELKKKGIKVRLAPPKHRSVPVEFWVYVSKRNWYWKFVEFGHVIAQKQRTRMERKIVIESWKGGYVAAKPFMRPAFEAKKEEALTRIKEYLSTRIDKEASTL